MILNAIFICPAHVGLLNRITPFQVATCEMAQLCRRGLFSTAPYHSESILLYQIVRGRPMYILWNAPMLSSPIVTNSSALCTICQKR